MSDTIENNLLSAIDRLSASGVDNARQEACWLLEELLGISPGTLSRRLGETLAPQVVLAFDRQVSRRVSGEPLQYVIGNVDFYSIRLSVGPGVLIPRPETEGLVEEVLKRAGASRLMCDVCTGSGAIALALATECPDAHVWGTDLSSDALAWARRNAEELELDNVTLLEGDLFSPLPDGLLFDLITANPPYVSEEAYAGLDSVVKDYEPRMALVAADHGLALLRRIVAEAPARLVSGGWLFCEIGDEQGEAMRDLLLHEGYNQVEIVKDLAGQDRIALGQYPGNPNRKPID